MPSLRSVPDAPPRAVLYVRVSQERDEMTSPALQRVACEDYCARMGYQVVDVVEDIDVSGRLWKRRKIEQVVQRIETGDVDVIVGWKWSRFSRNRKDWAIAVDRVEAAGGRLESATEPTDTTTSTGRLARGMLAEFAAFESERIGDTWRETHSRRVREGKPINGKPRFGYRSVNKRFELEEKEAPVLASLYRRYIAGESFYSLVKWLNDEGWTTVPSYGTPGPWSAITLRRVLDSGFGAGLITVKDEQHPGQHEAVISELEWKQYRAERERRGHGSGTGERSTYLLSGLIFCQCGSRMNGGRFGGGKRPKYRCAAAAKERRHDGGYVMCDYADQVVREWVEGLDLEVGPPAAAIRDVQRYAREITALDKQLADLTKHLLSGLVPEAAYRATRDEIETQKQRLESSLRDAEVDVVRRQYAPQVARDLARDWDVLPVENAREMLRSLISQVTVTPKRPRSDVVVMPRWVGDQRA